MFYHKCRKQVIAVLLSAVTAIMAANSAQALSFAEEIIEDTEQTAAMEFGWNPEIVSAKSLPLEEAQNLFETDPNWYAMYKAFVYSGNVRLIYDWSDSGNQSAPDDVPVYVWCRTSSLLPGLTGQISASELCERLNENIADESQKVIWETDDQTEVNNGANIRGGKLFADYYSAAGQYLISVEMTPDEMIDPNGESIILDWEESGGDVSKQGAQESADVSEQASQIPADVSGGEIPADEKLADENVSEEAASETAAETAEEQVDLQTIDAKSVFQLREIVNQTYARVFWNRDWTNAQSALISLHQTASEMNPETRASLLYWYVSSHYAKEDPRVQRTGEDAVAFYSLNRQTAGDMMKELIGVSGEEDVQAFYDTAYAVEGDMAIIGGQTGGQYPGCRYVGEPTVSMEQGRLKITRFIENDYQSSAYSTIYCRPDPNGIFGGYMLDEFSVDADVQIPAEDQQTTTIMPLGITASSVRETEPEDSYEPEHAVDGNPVTAWVEGVDGLGAGEYLELSYPAGTVFRQVRITPGFCKSEDLFHKNAAPVTLAFSTGGKTVLTEDDYAADNYTYALGEPTYDFSEELVCDGTLRITILGVREGSVYDETCISELEMIGKPGATGAGAAAIQEEQNVPEGDSGTGWKEEYRKLLNGELEGGGYAQDTWNCALIDIDENGVPELLMMGQGYMYGDHLFTVSAEGLQHEYASGGDGVLYLYAGQNKAITLGGGRGYNVRMDWTVQEGKLVMAENYSFSDWGDPIADVEEGSTGKYSYYENMVSRAEILQMLSE